jgi:alkylation response protein AidB-like acyl-CoA dehydrogenase
MIPHEETVLSLVQTTAKAFALRHRAELDTIEQRRQRFLPIDVLNECRSLGWLDSLSEETIDDNTKNPEGENGEAAVLAALVFELGKVSPTLGSRLLCHHYARRWLEAARRNDNGLRVNAPAPEANSDWLSVPAFDTVTDRSTANETGLRLDRESLTGELTMVVGGPESTTVLALARHAVHEHAFVQFSRTLVSEPVAVATLGLTGLGVVDLEMSPDSSFSFDVLAVGPKALTTRNVAFQMVLPAYVALCRAILTNSEQTAIAYTNSRYQGGGYLNELPEIQGKLQLIARVITFSQLLEQSCLRDSPPPVHLIVSLKQALLQATDAGLQLLGGAGYVVGSGQERHWRDARQLAAMFGSNLGHIGT